MTAVDRPQSVQGGVAESAGIDARGQACDGRRRALVRVAYAGVSATAFAFYALVVSAAGASPSVHAAGLLLWVVHAILSFGRTPGQKSSFAPGRAEDVLPDDVLDRAADAAAGGVHARSRAWRGDRPEHASG